MTSRRKFFKQFIGQIGALRDDFRGVVNIPLNRLNELPESIIEEIEPVFFQDEYWIKEDDIIYISYSGNDEQIQIRLSGSEKIVFNLFEQGITLKQVSLQIKDQLKISYDEAFHQVSSLFFKLASHRICHPREILKIDELIKNEKE